MASLPVQIDEVERRLVATAPDLSVDQQRVVAGLVRLLAQGEPVPPERAEEELRLTPAAVESAVAGLRSAVRDDEGRVVACYGLTLFDTPHELAVDGRRLHTWCAWDGLILPQLLRRGARVTTRCPVTGSRVSVDVEPEGIVAVEPPAAAMSFVIPDERPDASIFESFCRFVNFFESRAAAAEWVAARDQVFVLSVEEGHGLGLAMNRACFPALLPDAR